MYQRKYSDAEVQRLTRPFILRQAKRQRKDHHLFMMALMSCLLLFSAVLLSLAILMSQ